MEPLYARISHKVKRADLSEMPPEEADQPVRQNRRVRKTMQGASRDA